LQQEIDDMENDYSKKIRKLEEAIRFHNSPASLLYFITFALILPSDKDKEVAKLKDAHEAQAARADRALSEFKSQVESNTTKMYDEMKQQVSTITTV
jgi:centrosomal protein CEP112